MYRYKVKRGDNPLSVAQMFNLSPQSLLSANPGVSSLATGMTLKIPGVIQGYGAPAGTIRTGDNQRKTAIYNGQIVRIPPNSMFTPGAAQQPSFWQTVLNALTGRGLAVPSNVSGVRGSEPTLAPHVLANINRNGVFTGTAGGLKPQATIGPANAPTGGDYSPYDQYYPPPPPAGNMGSSLTPSTSQGPQYIYDPSTGAPVGYVDKNGNRVPYSYLDPKTGKTENYTLPPQSLSPQSSLQLQSSSPTPQKPVDFSSVDRISGTRTDPVTGLTNLPANSRAVTILDSNGLPYQIPSVMTNADMSKAAALQLGTYYPSAVEDFAKSAGYSRYGGTWVYNPSPNQGTIQGTSQGGSAWTGPRWYGNKVFKTQKAWDLFVAGRRRQQNEDQSGQPPSATPTTSFNVGT